ncbi:hypothetical protein [Poseidonocella sp. HB161398]|uniref:hypothetical protein n=1 Tax=Poseidonocella sp. HB161398 TaxID=2320855 RepID=UPI001107FC35|nr:hypothetical protein [Poseidonocella sp. HB161398]
MAEPSEFRLTHHARKRMVQRMGLNKRAGDRTFRRAVTTGMWRSEMSDSLRRMCDAYWQRPHHQAGKASDYILSGGHVFIMRGTVCVTVIGIPKMISIRFLAENRRRQQR